MNSVDVGLIFFFLAIVLCLFSSRVQLRLQRWLAARPAAIFAVPLALTALFSFAVWRHGAGGMELIAVISAYTFGPTILAYLNGPGGGQRHERPHTAWLDLATIVILWLPLELGVGRTLVPKPIQGPVHTLAYGVAVTLALFLFLLFRGLPGMKYRLPSGWRDFALPLAGLILLVPVLIGLALALSFIQPFHVSPGLTAATVGKRFVLILLGVALPEEILFRALIQNWLMQRFGFTVRTLAMAAVIFGAAHLNNGPFPFPNWRYLILATMAGFVYGKVFQEAHSVISSALLHASVNTLRHSFF